MIATQDSYTWVVPAKIQREIHIPGFKIKKKKCENINFYRIYEICVELLYVSEYISF